MPQYISCISCHIFKILKKTRQLQPELDRSPFHTHEQETETDVQQPMTRLCFLLVIFHDFLYHSSTTGVRRNCLLKLMVRLTKRRCEHELRYFDIPIESQMLM